MQKAKVYVLNNNLSKEYPLGTSLREIAEDMKIKLDYPILGARVNNKLAELSYRIYKPKFVEFIDITNIDGYRMYQRSLSFVLMKAVRDILPKARLKIEHSISQGFYCEVEKPGDERLKPEEVLTIAERMRQIINADIPFEREEIPTQQALEIFEENHLYEKVKLFKTRPILFTSIYKLDDQIDYFYGYLVPSTGYLKVFDLIPYYDGMLLRFPTQQNPDELGPIVEQPKLFEIFREYKQWVEILGVSTVGSINEQVQQGKAGDLIKISEALHEKKVAQIADMIKHRGDVRLVLIAGPSSSGKTTFSKRLSVQLRVIGYQPVTISLDNFFVDREKTPRDENGDYDFESLYALDLELFNKIMNQLIAGEEVELPKFNFQEGKRYYDGTKVKLSERGIIVIEGIHGLNPELTRDIDEKYKFKIYVSALTQIGIDYHNRIPTTDNRLLRRMIRDFQFRGYSLVDTLKRWPSVRRGEERNIFPFQEEADVMFNSALIYEFNVLKKHLEPLLREVPETVYEYSEAVRLLKFLSYFVPIRREEREIPPTSILREFISGSAFKY